MGAQSVAMAGKVPPFTIEHQGKTYRMRMVDNHVLSTIERKLYQRDLESIAPMRGVIPEEDYRAQLAAARQLYLDGEYHLMSDKAKEFFKTKIGLIFFMETLFDTPITQLMGVIQARQDELRMMVNSILYESIPDVDFNKIELEEKTRVHGAVGAPVVTTGPLTPEEVKAAGEPVAPKS